MIYLFAIGVIALLLVSFSKKENLPIALGLIVIILGVFSYFIQPIEQMDLFRHFELFRLMEDKSFSSLIQESAFLQQPLAMLYFFLLSKSGIPGVLTAVTALITYGLPMYALHGLAKYDNGLSDDDIKRTIAVVLCCFSYLTVTGVRQGIAFSLFVFGLFIGSYTKKKSAVLSYLFYIAACLVHSSLVAMLMLKILSNKKLPRLLCWMFSTATLGWIFLVGLVGKVLGQFTNIPLFSLLHTQITYYIQRGYFEPLSFLVRFAILFTITVVYYYMRKLKIIDVLDDKRAEIGRFFELVLLFTWGAIPIYDVFVRFVLFLVLASVLILPFFYSLEGNALQTRIVKLTQVTALGAVTYYFLFSYPLLQVALP